MTTGEGGMLVTNDDELYEKLRLLRSHGMTTLTWDRHKGHAWSYDVVEIGHNYRIDEIRAAIGMTQLKKLDRNNARRRQLTQRYFDFLQDNPRLVVPFKDHPGISSAHIMPVLLPRGSNRVAFMEYMKVQGIQTSIHYPPIHMFSAYQPLTPSPSMPLSVTEGVAVREVTLPLYPAMTDEAVNVVVQDVVAALEAC